MSLTNHHYSHTSISVYPTHPHHHNPSTDIDTRLKSLGPLFLRRVEEDCGTEELLGYWCVQADRGEINLEEKVFALLERNNELARVLFAFAQAHAEAGTDALLMFILFHICALF